MPKRPTKSLEERGRRAADILPVLDRLYPNVRVTLDHANPLELLVATILSAQCTDERVNIVTRRLFAKYRTAADYAKVPQAQLERDIQSTGFFRNKAKSIRAMAAALVQRHAGQVPATMEELTQLAGVGRKTANVVLGNAFGKNLGVVVDTHVGRVSRRLGLSRQKTPEKIEQDLMPIVPQARWARFSLQLIQHGRALCQARKPRCDQCPVRPHCALGCKA